MCVIYTGQKRKTEIEIERERGVEKYLVLNKFCEKKVLFR